MTRYEFISVLKEKLYLLNENECRDIIEEYMAHIDMKMAEGKSEADAIKDFGNIGDLASEILAAYHIDSTRLNDMKQHEEKTAETTKNMVAVIANGGVTYAVTIPVTAYHFVIGNETEFFAWRNSAGTYASAPNELAPTYAILDANVPLQGTLAGFASGAKRGMVGFLDGNGFTVSNIQITGVEPLFSSAYNFTFKNIGLDITGASYYFFNATGPTPAPGSNHMYNCWINLHSNNHRQFCHLGDIFGSVENLVINWETTSKTVDGYGFFRSSNPASFSNILATLRTTASDVQMPLFSAAADTTGKNIAVFKTVEEASANLLSETPSFDTSVLSEKYWVIGANGFPVWRNA